MDELIAHYNKFNEDKRLCRRHGQVEYITTMRYIHKYLELVQQNTDKKEHSGIRIMDVGAGTGRYSIALAKEGYQVTAVEYVKYNLGRLKQNAEKEGNLTLTARQGDARNLKKYPSESFDLVLLFGPMYHLYSHEDKLLALREAKRITRPGGYILVAYLMNEYGVLTYGFKENHVKECLEDGRLDAGFHCHSTSKDLYEYVRLEDIDRLVLDAGLHRCQIISADGPADYLRRELREMDDETFQQFLQYHLTTCERPELLGAGAHTVDILQKCQDI